MTIFAIPRAHTFAPQIKFNKHSSYSLFFNCSKCSYWLLLKIFIFILESASGCLGIYCFISIIPCVMRILPFQTILLPFCYCSPARRRALTHTPNSTTFIIWAQISMKSMHVKIHQYVQIRSNQLHSLAVCGLCYVRIWEVYRVNSGVSFP